MDRQIKTPASFEDGCLSRPLRLPNDRDWLGAFTGVLLWLTQPFNWVQLNESDLTPDQAALFAQQILNEYFAASEDCNEVGCCKEPLKRMTDAGIIETSTDDGETWTPNKSADPRETSIMFPPLLGEDGTLKACKASENMVEQLTGNIEQFVADLTVITNVAAFATAVAGVVAVVLSAGALIPAVALLATSAYAAGSSAISAAFTSEVWDRLQCNVFCKMGEDGRLTAADIAAIKAQIAEDESGIALTILIRLIDNYGTVGLNNLAAIQGVGSGATCEECDCAGEWCWMADFNGAVAHGFEFYNPTGTGTGFLGADGWTAGVDAPNSVSGVQARKEFAVTQISKVTYNYSLDPDDAGGGYNNIQIRLFLEGVQVHAVGFVVDSTQIDQTYVWEWEAVTCDMAQIGLECGAFAPYGTGSIHTAQFEGTGEPIETPNCE